jgi:hypothetical protein
MTLRIESEPSDNFDEQEKEYEEVRQTGRPGMAYGKRTCGPQEGIEFGRSDKVPETLATYRQPLVPSRVFITQKPPVNPNENVEGQDVRRNEMPVPHFCHDEGVLVDGVKIGCTDIQTGNRKHRDTQKIQPVGQAYRKLPHIDLL